MDDVVVISSSSPASDQTNPHETSDEPRKTSPADGASSVDTASPIDSTYATKTPRTIGSSADTPEEPMADDGDEDSDISVVVSKKRKIDEVVEEEPKKPLPKTIEEDVEAEAEAHAETRSFSCVQPPGIVNPKSVYGERPAPKKLEHSILSIFLVSLCAAR